VILATGVVDHYPAFEGVTDHPDRSVTDPRS
jgi:hypothetical protein